MEQKMLRLTAKTFHGMEQMLADELTDLKAERIKILNRAVQFSGDKEMYYKANYRCRTALRVLSELSYFKAHNEDYLYRKVREIPWDSYIAAEDTFAIDKTVNSQFFKHSQFAALRVKDAIVDFFNDKYGERPSVDTKEPDVLIDLHISNERVNISLDTSGQSLYKRGYRKETVIAPINEVLAAGLVKASGYDGKVDFYDPMCGSGTLLCEVAEAVLNIPPGYHRKHFGFMNFRDFDQKLWTKVKSEADSLIKSETNVNIMGADIDSKALASAKENIKAAGLNQYIKLHQTDFFKTNAPSESGLMMTNPPYDERLELPDIDTFYKSIGDSLKQNYAGWTAHIFSGYPAASKKVGLRTEKKQQFYNGKIDSRLLKYKIFKGRMK